nr:stage II sporulation protein M [uncultured Undibacterium sp.]
MKQKQFEMQNEALWDQIKTILEERHKKKNAPVPVGIQEFPALYRRLCQNLALALQRGYSPALTDYLQKMVGDCHQLLYGTAVERPMTLHRWLLNEFPQRVREEWRLLLFVCLAFWGVGLLVGVLVWFNPEMAYSFLSANKLEKMRQMYMSSKIGVGRGAEGDFAMFGMYIWNNISIDFRTFGAGVFGGIPALYIMGVNGLNMGVVASWLSADPATRHNFWSFVITHGSFEIVGMLLSGVAGMRLGFSLIQPGRLTRRRALYAASQRMFPVLVGASILTFIAAFFEAFWSASPVIPHSVKYAVGALCWLLVIGFFIFAGRVRR